MKRVLIVALVLLMSVCCFASCDAIEQKIGETISVAAVDAAAAELEKQGVTYQAWSEEELASFAEDWKKMFDKELTGKFTSGFSGSYQNSETGAWVEYYVYGLSSANDADMLEQYWIEEYASEIEEGRVIVVNGGYIVNVTISSEVIKQD